MATEAGLEAEPAQSAVAAMPAGSGREAELAALREFVRPEWVESCSLQMVRLNICRTRVLRLVLTATMLDGYWESSDVAVQLSSPTLPPALLAKLELACDKEARAHAGKPQLVAVAKLVLAYLETNRLVCAWDELVQARALVCTPPESDGADLEAFTASNWLRLAEKAGKVHVRAQQGAYFMEFSLLVPDTYPDAPPVLTLIATNFDDKLRDICLANAADVIRRMHEGYSTESVLFADGPPPGREEKRAAAPDLSSSGLRQMKHDREFLHTVAQVRGAVDRKFRRIIEHGERKTIQQQASEQAKLEESLALDSAGGRLALPTVLAVVRYIVERTVRELPTALCPVCAKTVLPADPGAQHEALGGNSKLGAIERPHCGHWFHQACLEAKLTAPPFTLSCAHPRCGKAVYLPRFSDKVEKLEKRWALEQAKTREIEELAGLMNM